MNYYYDILMNFEDEYFMFYEWDENDPIIFIKKIPLIHIDTKVYKDIISKKIKVNKSFLNTIYNKTKVKQNSTYKYTCIFGDGKNAIGVEFNDDGIIICKSSILLDDELNINEFMFSIDLTNIKYDILEKEKIRKEIRKDEKIRKILLLEINDMYQNNKSKLKYIYLEWFNTLSDNYELMYNNMVKKLKRKLTKKEYEIYSIIKKSFSA